jgi:SAM-dependent methyltransferase
MNLDSHLHWEKVYGTKADDEVSWYEPSPDLSLKLVREAEAQGARSVIDIGGGTSRLVDGLLDDDLDRLAVLDLSETALERARDRLGSKAERVEWIQGDITQMTDVGRFDVWHDRALFHFITSDEGRRAYRSLLERTVTDRGWAIIATFGPQGPERCSGLEVERYDAESLAREVGSGFKLHRSELVDHTTPREKHQQFVYTVFGRAR